MQEHQQLFYQYLQEWLLRQRKLLDVVEGVPASPPPFVYITECVPYSADSMPPWASRSQAKARPRLGCRHPRWCAHVGAEYGSRKIKAAGRSSGHRCWLLAATGRFVCALHMALLHAISKEISPPVLSCGGCIYFKSSSVHNRRRSTARESNMVCTMPVHWWCSSMCSSVHKRSSAVFDHQ